jgi:hypothetical protein
MLLQLMLLLRVRLNFRPNTLFEFLGLKLGCLVDVVEAWIPSGLLVNMVLLYPPQDITRCLTGSTECQYPICKSRRNHGIRLAAM